MSSNEIDALKKLIESFKQSRPQRDNKRSGIRGSKRGPSKDNPAGVKAVGRRKPT